MELDYREVENDWGKIWWVFGGGGSSSLGGMFPARMGDNAPVFRQAHRSLFYNRGGAVINGQMM